MHNDPINRIDPAGTQSYPVGLPEGKYPPFFDNPLGSPGACAKPAYLNWTWGNSPIAGGGTGNPAEGEGTLWAVADIPDTCCAVNGPPKVGQINVYYSTLSRMLTIDLNDRGDEILTYGNRLCDPTAEEELRKEFNVMFSMNVNNCNISPAFLKSPWVSTSMHYQAGRLLSFPIRGDLPDQLQLASRSLRMRGGEMQHACGLRQIELHAQASNGSGHAE